MATLPKGRIEYIDLAKGFCIILVVVFHLTLYYKVKMPASDFFMSFRMPLYFFLSGFFFKQYEGFGGFLKRKTNKLLIPFVFYYFLFSVVLALIEYNILGFNIVDSKFFTIKDAILGCVWIENFPYSSIWFLLCLFEINILFYFAFFIGNISHKYSIQIIIFICAIIGLFGQFLCYKKLNFPLYIDSAFTALPFFCMGYLINKHTNLLYPNRIDKYAVPLIILLLFLVSILASHVNYRKNLFAWPCYFTMYPSGLFGTLAIIYIAKKIKYLPFISYWGRYSIIILVTHKVVFAQFGRVLNYFNIHGWTSLSINLFLTLLSYQLIIPFVKKYLPYVTAQKDIIKINTEKATN